MQAQPPTPTPPRRRRARWLALVALLVVLAGVGTYLLVRPTEPASAQELADLLMNPPGHDSRIVISPGAGPLRSRGMTATGGDTGARWTVARVFNRPDLTAAGVISLTQYETAAQARVAVAEVRQGADLVHGSPQQLDLERGAYLVAADTDEHVHNCAGAGASGRIVAFVFAQSESTQFARQLLTQQLDRLP